MWPNPCVDSKELNRRTQSMHPHARIRPVMPLPAQGLGWLHAVLLLLGLWWAGAAQALPPAGERALAAAVSLPHAALVQVAALPQALPVCREARPALPGPVDSQLVEVGDTGAPSGVVNSFVPSPLRPQPLLRSGLAQTVAEPLLRPPTALG